MELVKDKKYIVSKNAPALSKFDDTSVISADDSELFIEEVLVDKMFSYLQLSN
jgi:hypothetical protein